MKKMLYLGHKYHLKTKSTTFLINLLKSRYEIDFVLIDPYSNEYEGLEDVHGKKYDILVVFQIMPRMRFIKEHFRYIQGVLFPMYDYIATRPYDPWPEYRDFKIINFSKTIHKQLKQRGFETYYIQFFPEPIDAIHEFGQDDSIFFWQRMEEIDLATVSTLTENMNINHIHIHKALDPMQSEGDTRTNINSVSFSEWFDDPNDMKKKMLESSFYIAPRRYEGIGMSFLEAMAQGRCVIAPDCPTMNEYIQHGETGFLYDIENIEPLNLNEVSIREIQTNALEYIKKGYEEWEKCKYDILDWMEEKPTTPLVTVITVIRNVYEADREEMLVRCISSVHAQTYSNIQHLIIDGDSDDNTLDLLDEYCDRGWIDYYSEADNGMYEAMNKGINKAKGKYIVFLNSDDFFHNPYAITKSVRALENSGADFSYASNRLLREDGLCTSIRKPDIGSFISQMPFCHQTMFAKKDVLIQIGMFNEKYKSAADYDLVIRLLLGGYSFVDVEDTIVTYSQGGVSESMEERSNAEKRDIYLDNYGKILTNVKSEEIGIIGSRRIRKDAFEALLAAVSDELRNAILASVVSVDDEHDEVCMPLEIIEPIGENTSLGQLKGNVVPAARYEKFKQYFDVMNYWMELKNKNINIEEFFVQKGFYRIAIYGIGEIGTRLFEEAKSFEKCSIVYAIDKQKKDLNSIQVIEVNDDYPEADVVVVSVCNIFNQIKEMLHEKTDIEIISISDVVNELHKKYLE